MYKQYRNISDTRVICKTKTITDLINGDVGGSGQVHKGTEGLPGFPA